MWLSGGLLLTLIAQSWHATDRPEPYVPIGSIPGIQGITPITLVASGPFYPAEDEGFAADIPLGFTFDFLGTDVTEIGLSSNGWVGFGAGALPPDGGNDAPGNPTAPNQIVALWWDDLGFTSGAYGVIGAAPDRIFVLELSSFGYWSDPGPDGAMAQLWVYEGPAARFEVRYGGSAAGTAYSASTGWEGLGGRPFGTLLPCGNACSSADLNQLADRAFTIELIQAPELTVAFGAVPPGAHPGGTAVSIDLTLTNRGVATATAVEVKLALSQDQTLDAGDLLLQTTLRDLPAGDTQERLSIALPAPTPVGPYYLLAEVDAGARHTEIDETDNLAVASFAVGPDLSPAAVVPPLFVQAGSSASFDLTLLQSGAPYTGPVEVRLRASADALFDQTDPFLFTTTVDLVGAPAEQVQVTGVVPSLPPGPYHTVVEVDPAAQISETDETNNGLLSAVTFEIGADFRVDSVSTPPPAAPGGVVTVHTTIGSAAAPFTGTIPYRLFASADRTLDAADLLLGQYTVTFSGGPSVTSSPAIALPAALGPGRYHLIAEVDPQDAVAEVDETNNMKSTTAPLVVGSDFSLTGVSFGPAAVEVGDVLTVQGTVSSSGIPYGGTVPVRVFLSADATWDPGDDAVHTQDVLLAGSSGASFAVTFPLPRTSPITGDAIVPANYTVIFVVDPDGGVAEANEVNNTAAASGTLEIRGADLRVVSMTGPPVAFSGRPYEVTLTLENDGVADAVDFSSVFFLSEDSTIRIFDTQVGSAGPTTIPSGGNETITATVDIPVLTATASLYLGVIVDLFDAVPETDTANNIGRIVAPLPVIFPIPDLAAQIVEAATAAAAGEDLAVKRRLMNTGVEASGPFEYGYYLSTNPVITTDDILIGSGSESLPVGGDDVGIDVINVPAVVSAGTYYLGLVVDPSGLVVEVDEGNNAALGPQITLYAATIRFITRTLPPATLGVRFEVGVYAVGGPAPLSYTVVDGALPGGLVLDAASGIISGTPEEEGRFELTIRAAAGTAYADQPFMLRVAAPTVPLEVVTASLRSGITGRPYRASLLAVGGTPPHRWSAISGLPAGLALSASGEISGIPEAPGRRWPVTFRVRDDAGQADSRELALNVVNAGQTVQIRQFPLPTAIIGLPYCDPETIRLEAENGVPPYRFSLLQAPPPGMHLSPEGALCGTPSQVGRHPLTVRAQDQTGLFDTGLFILEVDDGTALAVSTFSLPPARVGEPFNQNLSAIRGTGPYTWRVVEAWGTLPPGIALAEDGTLSGKPTEEGSYAFVVQVEDAELRTDTQPLSIQVAPAAVPLENDGGCGCSGAGRGSSGSSLLLALLGLLVARRKRSFALLVAIGISAAPAGAAAQFVPGTPYQLMTTPITYQPCSNPTVLATDDDDSEYDVTIPFQFKFYDVFPTSITVGANGAVTFPAGQQVSFSNETPGNSGLDAFVAFVWDDLRLYPANNGLIGWQVDGVAPNRTLTICYENMSRFSTQGVTFSSAVRLFEGTSGRIEVDYGPLVGTGGFSATMGMEDDAGARPILFHPGGCTDDCGDAEIASLANTRVIVVQDPGVDVTAAGVVAPELAFLGAQTDVAVTVSNLNGNPVGPFTVTVEAGDGPAVENPVTIGTAAVTLAPFETRTVSVPSVFPAGLGERSLYLALVADSAGVVNEVNEVNNRATSATPVRLLQGKPDLAVTAVVQTATAPVASGGTLTVHTTVRNAGGEPAPSTEVVVVLSSNPVISAQDLELGRHTVLLGPGESATSTNTVTIPGDTNSGVFTIGAFADPDDLVDELSESNNGLAAPAPVTVDGGDLAVVTLALPGGYVAEPYYALLAAVGGDGTYLWEVGQGSLPAGLGLVAGTGEIFGRPQAAETQNVTFRVSSDGASAEASYTLRVEDPGEPLTIVTRTLASAVVGQAYRFALVATGGAQTSSTTWTAEGVPPGLALSPDGLLAGTPVEVGTSTLSVMVTAGAETASRPLTLRVRSNANLLIVPRVLSTARFGELYEEQLAATGGLPPIQWSFEGGEIPEGLALTLGGKISGTPMEVGRFIFVVEARDSAAGQQNATDVNAFEIEVMDSGGVTIITDSIPDAVVNEGYDVRIVAEGGSMPYEWTIEGDLPHALLGDVNPMTGEYRIAGRAEQIGVSNLLVGVTDSQGRSASRALSLRVVEPSAAGGEGGGCGCNETDADDGATGFMALLLGAGLLLRRRAVGALVAAAAVMTFGGDALAQLLPGTPYQFSTESITYTPLSNPTVIWTTGDEEESDLSLPFSVKYYDQTVNQITVGVNGAIVFQPGQNVSLTNQAPGSSTLDGWLALFWEDLQISTTNGGSIGYQVEGTAPNRTLTIEYNNVNRWNTLTAIMNGQIRLYEGQSGRIEIDYGPITGAHSTFTGSMGMEDLMGGRPIFFHPSMCTTSCSYADVMSMSNTRITVVQDPGIEVVASAVTAPAFAFLSAPTSIEVLVQNLHGTPLGPFTIEVRAGTGPTVMNPVSIGTLDVTLNAFSSMPLTIPAIFPQSLGEALVYLEVIADANGALNEVEENNNRAVSVTPTRLLTGAADLAVLSVTTNTTEIAGDGMVTVYSTVRNVGGMPANNVDVAVMLSSNPVVSPQDLELDRFNVTLAPGEIANATTTVALSGVDSGTYYAGALADPEGTLDELSEANNGRAAFNPLTVSGGALAITTTALPTGYVQESYTALLSSVGGDVDVAWEVSQGTLPAGMGLVGASGELYGRPSTAEMQTVTIRATSGNQTDEKTYTIVVSDPDEPLTVVSRAVPPAVAGQEYSFQLIATGGEVEADLTWSAEGLPAGLAITADGIISGSVPEIGTSTLTVTVDDGTSTASRMLTLEVRENANLLIVPEILSTGRYNEPYSATLQATGGTPPLTWLLQLGQLPEGVDLSADGQLSGTPLEVGEFRFVVEARDSGAGGLSATDVNTFVLEVLDAPGFQIDTEELPRGVVGAGYSAQISATGGLAPYDWRLEEGRTPMGLLPSINQETGEFLINGTPAEAGITNLLVVVTDAQGRTAHKAFALIVDESAPVVEEPVDEGGCGCTAGRHSGGAGLGLLFVGALFLLRRRRR